MGKDEEIIGLSSNLPYLTGEEMIVWGGTDGTAYFNSGHRYFPDADNWSALAVSGAPTGRRNHTAI